MTIIALSNETTASECFYEVSDKVFELLGQLTERELAEAMPKQTPYGMGYESVSYASALAELAKRRGVPEHDIAIKETTVPTFFFDTGWKGGIWEEPAPVCGEISLDDAVADDGAAADAPEAAGIVTETLWQSGEAE